MARNHFSIGEAAELTHMTSETLRHYDRIGLVKPGKKDEGTGYRYYGAQELVRLNTVRALRLMDLPLREIKEALEYDDLEKVSAFFEQAEQRADDKIAQLEYAKSKIQLAKRDYEKKLQGKRGVSGNFVRHFPRRVILLSDTLEAPTSDNLWNYLSRFYQQLPPERRDRFAFEDLAGVYSDGDVSRLFAVCTRYADMDGLKVLPEGDYLCADCTEENRAGVWDALLETARTRYGVDPKWHVRIIVVSGILKWDYQFQIGIK